MTFSPRFLYLLFGKKFLNVAQAKGVRIYAPTHSGWNVYINYSIFFVVFCFWWRTLSISSTYSVTYLYQHEPLGFLYFLTKFGRRKTGKKIDCGRILFLLIVEFNLIIFHWGIFFYVSKRKWPVIFILVTSFSELTVRNCSICL